MGKEFFFNVLKCLTIPIILFISYYFHGGSNFQFLPIHHDDYTNFSSQLSDIFEGRNYVRPVSTFIIYSMASLGESGYLTIQYLTLSAYLLSVIVFLAKLLNVKLSFSLIIASTMLVSTLPNIVEYHFYSGLMTNLSSALFGMLAIILWQKDNGKDNIFIILLLLFLSAFSKEDFILPFLVYIIFSYFFITEELENKSDNKRFERHFIIALSSAAILTISMIYNKLAGSAFISSETTFYTVSFAIKNIITAYEFYLFRHEQFIAIISFVLSLSLIHVLCSRKKKNACFKVFSVVIITCSMVGPYSLLPNHLSGYYSFMWFVWPTVFICILLFKIYFQLSNKTQNFVPFILSMLFFVFFSLCYSSGRKSVIHWYESQQKITANILKTLAIFPLESDSIETIVIVTPPGLSPWSHSTGQYLQRKLGMHYKWQVLVNESDGFYFMGSENKYISVNSLSNYNFMKNKSPVIIFDQNGNGQIKRM